MSGQVSWQSLRRIYTGNESCNASRSACFTMSRSSEPSIWTMPEIFPSILQLLPGGSYASLSVIFARAGLPYALTTVLPSRWSGTYSVMRLSPLSG